MILVTGATGLVGGHLLWHLLQENEKVVAIKRTTSDLQPLRRIFNFYSVDPDNFLQRIEWRTADVLDEKSLDVAFDAISIVYHCAAVVSVGNGSDTMISTNVNGTRNVVSAALKKNVKKLCFVSSIAACGHAEDGKMVTENLRWVDDENRSAYSRSKFYSEAEVWRGIEKGLKAVIVNPGVILGVSGTSTGSSQIFSVVRKGLPFYTAGGSGYVDVRDVVRAMIELTKSDISGERFILVSENCSNKEVLSWMADGFGKRRPWIAIGKNVIWLAGILVEIVGKILGFEPVIDRGIAKSATNRAYYSSAKISDAIGLKFIPISQCIADVCTYQNKTKE